MRVTPIRSIAMAVIAGAATGCFALFSLDGYGPAGDIVDGGLDVRMTPDTSVVDAGRDVALSGHVIFVTSETFTGDLTGADGADSKCRDIAADAGVPGSYLAFVSDATRLAVNRLDLDAGPVQLSTGAIVAETVYELLTTGPRTAIAQDERGRSYVTGDCDGGLNAWTNTLADGGAGSPAQVLDCKSWKASDSTNSGLAGIVGGTGTTWAAGCTRTCDRPAALYCIAR